MADPTLLGAVHTVNFKKDNYRTRGGLSHTPVYRCWSNMLRRCSDPRAMHYALYGGRGIRVCERWKSFDNFIQDMGIPPKGLTLDRINSNGHYEPGNCRWATMAEQNNNRSANVFIEWEGRTQTSAQWAEELGVPKSTINAQRRRGMSMEEIVRRAKSPRKRVHAAAYEVLVETGTPAVMKGDSRLLHMIADRAEMEGRCDGPHTELRVLNALTLHPGRLVPGHVARPNGVLVRIFRLPEGVKA